MKNDHRATAALARLTRAGELTPDWVPDPVHEAIRDVVRARHAASLRHAFHCMSPALPPPLKNKGHLTMAASLTALRVTTTERRSFTAYACSVITTLREEAEGDEG